MRSAKRIVLIGILSTLALLTLSLPKAQAVVVLTNIATGYTTGGSSLSATQIIAVGAAVPAGPNNYIFQSLRAPLGGFLNSTVELVIYNDAGGSPGTVLAVGNQVTYNANTTVVMTTPTPVTLLAGQSYWFAIRRIASIASFWRDAAPPIAQTGIFTGLGYRFSPNYGGTWNVGPLTLPPFELNADPVPIPPTLPPPAQPTEVVAVPTPTFLDGRINNYDPGAPIAVYPAYGGLHIYYADGRLALAVTQEQIEAVPNKPDTNTLIAEFGPIAVHRLQSGEFQVVSPTQDGKYYFLIFGDYRGSNILPYRSYELWIAPGYFGTFPIFQFEQVALSSGIAVFDPNAVPPRPTNPDEVVVNQSGYLIVNTDNLSLRSGPGAEYTVLGILDGGTQLLVLGRNTDRSWWQVRAGTFTGWVNAQFVIIRGDLTDIPLVEADGLVTPPTLYVGFEGTPLYDQPSADEPAICAIAGNQEYIVTGRDSNSTWWQIEAACNGFPTTGWINAEHGILRNPADVSIPVVKN